MLQSWYDHHVRSLFTQVTGCVLGLSGVWAPVAAQDVKPQAAAVTAPPVSLPSQLQDKKPQEPFSLPRQTEGVKEGVKFDLPPSPQRLEKTETGFVTGEQNFRVVLMEDEQTRLQLKGSKLHFRYKF